MRTKEAWAMAILPVGAPGPSGKTRAKLVEAEPEGISGPGFESPHLHHLFLSREVREGSPVELGIGEPEIGGLLSDFTHGAFWAAACNFSQNHFKLFPGPPQPRDTGTD